MKIRLALTLLVLTGLVSIAGSLRLGSSAAAPPAGHYVNNDYRGGSSFDLVGAGPNLERCGAFPQNVELSFTGSGIDTEGGYNTAVFSACTNTITNLVFDLKATDTYAQTGDQVFIEGDPFVLEPNLDICAATNARGVKFRVAGGTGGHAGATGHGHFDIYSNLTPCNGLVVAAHVSFEGMIKVPN
ncbi:MAG TPA: hypothetical protein VN643_26345 [Pyrinomonadaceae bacterium]|nr:hypothetical protein [Pyrinomonadaceae bacterium]